MSDGISASIERYEIKNSGSPIGGYCFSLIRPVTERKGKNLPPSRLFGLGGLKS